MDDVGALFYNAHKIHISVNNSLDTAFIILYNRSNFRGEWETSLNDCITIRDSNFRFFILDLE